MIYGTAWKEDDTERLVRLALQSGFRKIDTANQRKHYFEAGVGAALQPGVWVQTKFTYQRGQDHRLPYDPKASLTEQVRQSYQSSLEHLRVDAIDSYVLHGPEFREGLSENDWETWRAMEQTGARQLGISNCSLGQLKALWEKAAVKPACVQNRCYASTRWDAEVRAFCREKGIEYQGFSLLTANVEVVRGTAKIAKKYGKTEAQVIYVFARQVGMTPMTGTTNAQHMREALETFTLTDEEVRAIEDGTPAAA